MSDIASLYAGLSLFISLVKFGIYADIKDTKGDLIYVDGEEVHAQIAPEVLAEKREKWGVYERKGFRLILNLFLNIKSYNIDVSSPRNQSMLARLSESLTHVHISTMELYDTKESAMNILDIPQPALQCGAHKLLLKIVEDRNAKSVQHRNRYIHN